MNQNEREDNGFLRTLHHYNIFHWARQQHSSSGFEIEVGVASSKKTTPAN